MNIDITDPELREVIEALGHHLFRLGIEKKRRREKTADGLLRRLLEIRHAEATSLTFQRNLGQKEAKA